MGRRKPKRAVRADGCRVNGCGVPRQCGSLWCMVHTAAIRDQRDQDTHLMSTFLRTA